MEPGWVTVGGHLRLRIYIATVQVASVTRHLLLIFFKKAWLTGFTCSRVVQGETRESSPTRSGKLLPPSASIMSCAVSEWVTRLWFGTQFQISFFSFECSTDRMHVRNEAWGKAEKSSPSVSGEISFKAHPLLYNPSAILEKGLPVFQKIKTHVLEKMSINSNWGARHWIHRDCLI